MKKYIIIVASYISIISCNTESKKVVKNYFPDGSLERIEHWDKKNNREGLCIYFFENENIDRMAYYKDDKPFGNFYQYYESGALMSVAKVAGGSQNGNVIAYYENGKIESFGSYKNDKADGITLSYNIDGVLTKIEYYRNDSLIAYKKIDKNGIITEESIKALMEVGNMAKIVNDSVYITIKADNIHLSTDSVMLKIDTKDESNLGYKKMKDYKEVISVFVKGKKSFIISGKIKEYIGDQIFESEFKKEIYLPFDSIK
jgi:hypothetical protein